MSLRRMCVLWPVGRRNVYEPIRTLLLKLENCIEKSRVAELGKRRTKRRGGPIAFLDQSRGELAAVVAIIAMLVLGLSRAKDGARRVMCRSGPGHIGRGVHRYALECDGVALPESRTNPWDGAFSEATRLFVHDVHVRNAPSTQGLQITRPGEC